MININETIIPDKRKLFNHFSKVIENGQITNNGEYVKKLEDLLNKTFNTKYSLLTSNGTIALHLALRSLEKKGEVITTPFSCIATTSSIIWEGFKPIFCDIDPETLCINPALIESKISKNTVAILAVHVFGNSCNIQAIHKVAKKHKLKVIYDGAQAFGTMYNGKSVFQYGDVSMLSLHAYKVVSSIEGGALFCKDLQLYEKLFKLRYFGKNKQNFEEMLGTNAKMSEFNAAYGLVSLENAEKELEKRKDIAFYYIKQFKNNTNIKLQKIEAIATPNYSYFPIILKDEKTTLKILKFGLRKGIVFRRYFYPAINTLDFIGSNESETPFTLDLSKRIVCIPINSSLKNNDLQRISNLIDENA